MKRVLLSFTNNLNYTEEVVKKLNEDTLQNIIVANVFATSVLKD